MLDCDVCSCDWPSENEPLGDVMGRDVILCNRVGKPVCTAEPWTAMSPSPSSSSSSSSEAVEAGDCLEIRSSKSSSSNVTSSLSSPSPSSSSMSKGRSLVGEETLRSVPSKRGPVGVRCCSGIRSVGGGRFFRNGRKVGGGLVAPSACPPLLGAMLKACQIVEGLSGYDIRDWVSDGIT